MAHPLEDLSALLAAEREAARKAELEKLLELQGEKQQLIARLRAEPTAMSIPPELVSTAQANIALIRHLVHCLRGLTGHSGDSTYNASGEAHSTPPQLLRIRL